MLLSPTIFAWRKLVIWYNEYSNFCNDFCPVADKATRMGFRHGGQKCIREEKLWESGIP